MRALEAFEAEGDERKFVFQEQYSTMDGSEGSKLETDQLFQVSGNRQKQSGDRRSIDK